MEVSVERTIEKPFASLQTALANGPVGWLPGPPRDDRATAELDVRLGRSRIARRVVVRTGELTDWPGHGRCRLPVAWQAAEHPERYPRLVGTLELTRTAPRRTKLTLRARYRPPAGPVGEAADRAVVHVAAVASVRAFVRRIAGVLERSAMSGELAAGPPFAHGGE
ncbi:MAG: hypothetical protein E6J41_30165 [Chloroflexi bacterium]|nr:MAG: hypothetical protein E6J41_30165 [Chloroflexota bacterium]